MFSVLSGEGKLIKTMLWGLKLGFWEFQMRPTVFSKVFDLQVYFCYEN